MAFEQFILNIKRAETPYYRFLKSSYRAFLNASVPTPAMLRPAGNALYHAHFGIKGIFHRIGTVLYRDPLFRYRCEAVGKRLKLDLLPEAPGHTAIYLGDDVTFHGKLGIYSGRVFDRPVLRVGNRVSIGHQVNFSCNREIVIEDDVYIANNCTFSDNDGHPLDPELRAAGLPSPAERTKAVHVCRYAWIGSSCFILKGVTVGEASIVGAGSVVTSDVPPYTIVAGNPAKVVKMLSFGPKEKVR